MLELPLSSSERTAYLAALRSSHRIRLGVTVLDRNEKAVHALDVPASQVLDGSIEVDAQADITRSLRLELLDPHRALGFDAASPAQSALFADNLLAVELGCFVPELDRWIDCPVFWGPVTHFERNRARVSIEALGKEALALDPHFVTQGYTIRKGRRVDDAIRDVMDRVGEGRYSLPEMGARLPRARSVEPEDEPFDVVKFGWEANERRLKGKGKKRHKERVTVEYNGLIALAGNFTLYYNGLGRLTARRRTVSPVLRLEQGRDLLSLPVVTYDALVARNHVVVTGARITTGKPPHRHHVQMRGAATLTAVHPLSPASLARNGKRRHLTEFVEVDNLKTKRACESRAQRILDERSRDGMTLAFEALPFPFLEEGDRVQVVTDDYTLDIPLQRFSIPLTAAGRMSVGYDR